MQNPLVSVVIPTHNASLFIAETILSVLSQTIYNIEVIIVDDASSDNTLQIVQNLAGKDNRIRYFAQEQRRGVSAARNLGIKKSQGNYIAFIDHDDLWLPQKLEKQLPLFKKDPEVGLVYSREVIMSEDGKIKGLTGGFDRPLRGYVFKELFIRHFIPIQTVVIKREVFDNLDEWFVESMEMAEEVELFLRIAYKWKVDYCDEVLAKWRTHPWNDSKLRLGLLVKDYNVILERLAYKIPNFPVDYKKEINSKRRWIAATRVKVLMAEGNKKEAFKEVGSFIRNFGICYHSLLELPLLLLLGFSNFDKIREKCINFYHETCQK